MKNTIYLFTGILTLALASCGGGSSDSDSFFGDTEPLPHPISIDNGLDTTVTLTISALDGADSTMTYDVAGYGLEGIELSENKYHITATTATDSLILDEDFEVTDKGYSYNLNLTKQDYILERVTYVVSENPELYAPTTSFTYDGKTYDDVDASVIPGALLVPNTWDYNLEDEMPEEVTIYSGQNEATRTKLYRSETFVLYLELFELFGDMDLGDFEGEE